MTGREMLQEVRRKWFEERSGRRQARELTMAEAAEMLGLTERTFRRWSGCYDTDGVEVLQDRRISRASNLYETTIGNKPAAYPPPARGTRSLGTPSWDVPI